MYSKAQMGQMLLICADNIPYSQVKKNLEWAIFIFSSIETHGHNDAEPNSKRHKLFHTVIPIEDHLFQSIKPLPSRLAH
jgi:hypothetical protein